MLAPKICRLHVSEERVSDHTFVMLEKAGSRSRLLPGPKTTSPYALLLPPSFLGLIFGTATNHCQGMAALSLVFDDTLGAIKDAKTPAERSMSPSTLYRARPRPSPPDVVL